MEEALQFVQFRWREIGIQLHLRASTLDNFKDLDPAKATGKMVEEYLKCNYNTKRFGSPTWSKIVEVVKKPCGGNNAAEAKNIAEKYTR